jgi:tetratricopeptide (TPR) repeat protein
MNRTLLTTLLTSASFTWAIEATHCAEDLTGQLANATKLIDAGKAKPAALMLRPIVRQNPNSAEAHMLLGAALASLAVDDKYDEAIVHEETAIKLDPQSSGARRILGMIFANQQKFDQAISLLTEASKLKPAGFAIHRDLGASLMAAGRLDESIAAYRKAIDIKPENVAVHSKLAAIYGKKKAYPEAIGEANEAVRLAGKRAESHLLLANLKLDSGDSAGAIEPFKTAVATNGFDSFGCKNPMTAASALSGLGWALALDKNASKATLQESLNYQKRAIKAWPSFPNAYIRSAELLSMQGKPKEAEDLYEKVFKGSRKNATIGVAYSTFLTKAGRSEEARAVLKAVLESSPENKQAADELAALEKKTH